MRPVARRILTCVAGTTAVLAGGALAFVAWPLPASVLVDATPVVTTVTDRHGMALRQSREPDAARRTLLPPGKLPVNLRNAFIAAEDQRFDSHPGVDPLAIVRAALQNLRAGRVVSGASTLTQQLARQRVPRQRTMLGKLGEAFWALRFNAHLGREQILRAYLDGVPLGNNTIGVESAAQLYFGRPAAQLSVPQAALLAGLARSPEACEPYRHTGCAHRRMRHVLQRMANLGRLDAEAAGDLATAPLNLQAPRPMFRAPHFVERVLAQTGHLGGGTVRTTLDLELQQDVEKIVQTVLGDLETSRVGQAAVMVMDNRTGDILAYVGSAAFYDQAHLGQNDGVAALRQPGSALKPFIYGMALNQGYTAASLLADVETHLATASGAYAPHNYDRRIHGPVRLRAALANSYNVPAVRLTEALGAQPVLALLRLAGLASLDQDAQHYGVGVVLGNGEVSLGELTAAYAGLARGGVRVYARMVLGMSNARGEHVRLNTPPVTGTRFLPADVAALLTDIISDESARIPAFGLDNALRLPFATAAKTGTSRAHVDNWTLGFTRERTVGVWVGNFDGQPMLNVSGITGAGPVFNRVMVRAMRGITPAPLVDLSRFEHVAVCALSGQRAGPGCPSAVVEHFLPTTVPRHDCTMHRTVAQSGAHCAQAAGGRDTVLDVGPAFYGWARAEGLHGGPWPDCMGPGQAVRPQFAFPVDGDQYLLEPDAPAGTQHIPVKVIASAQAHLELHLDADTVIPLAAPFAVNLAAAPGTHRLELWERGGVQPVSTATYRVR